MIDSTITANNTNAAYQWLDCDNGYSVLNGETNVSYTAYANGNYAVELTENGCVDTSACVGINIVGLLENSFTDRISVYPNPTSGKLSIEFESVQEELSIRVFSFTGQEIKNA